MNNTLRKIAIPGLRWTLGLVILLQSSQFAFSPVAAHRFAVAGFPLWVRPVLAGTEILAALIFLIPAWTYAGGCLLLFIFAFAAAIHFLHREFDISILVLYAMATIACMANHQSAKQEPSHV